MATINDAFQTFLKELGSKADYIYTPQGNTGSKLIQELVSEGISYTNLNGYLLINKNDLDKVRQLNKDILTEQTNIYKETDEKAISEQLKESGKPEMPTMVLDNVPMHLYTNIKDAIKGIPHLIMCPEEKTENTYRINISKNKLLSKKGKNVAQAVLESMLKNIAGDSTKNISKMEEKIKADNYINMYQTATNAYHITSEIDPSVFMTVSKDGFAMCHWQVSTKGLERVVDYRENISDIDYEARFNKALERFPDVKIMADNSKLNNFVMKHRRPSISLKDIKTNRGIKALAKKLNELILQKENSPEKFSLNAFIKEAVRIIDNAKSDTELIGYNKEDLDAVKDIIDKYSLNDEAEKFTRQPEKVPECYEGRITAAESERSKERDANPNREGTL